VYPMGIHTIHVPIATYIDDIPDVALTNVIIITGKRIINMLSKCFLRYQKTMRRAAKNSYYRIGPQWILWSEMENKNLALQDRSRSPIRHFVTNCNTVEKTPAMQELS